MKVIRQASELAGRKVCLAIGVFDGVHLGHQQVLRQTIADAHQHRALAVAITFDRHPGTVVAPQRVPPLIHSLPQKLRAIRASGIDATLLIHFDQLFSELPAEVFVRGLARDFGPIYSICVGAGFTFGHKRMGNVAFLQSLGKELKFSVHGLAAVSLDGKTVSSTRIRESIRVGNLDAASQMLGRPYSVAGRVVHGDALGRQLGVPTANLEITGLVLPPNGVYAAYGEVRGEPRPLTLPAHRGHEPRRDELHESLESLPLAGEGSRASWNSAFRTAVHASAIPAAVNIGSRPTLANAVPEPRVEAHLLDFTGDLYEQELELTFVEKLRDEQRFATLDALKDQIQRDIAATRAVVD